MPTGRIQEHVRRDSQALCQANVEAVGQAFDLFAGELTGQIHPGADDEPGRAEPHRQQLDKAVDARVGLDLRPDLFLL
jgi:hypothetical protein